MLLLAAALQLGCEPAPRAEQRLQMRRERVLFTANTVASSEARRPAKVAAAAAYVPMSLERSATRLRRNAQGFVEWQQRDVQRFQSNGPVYRDKAGRLIWGHPERIEPMSAWFL